MKTAAKKPPHPNRIPFTGVLCRVDEPSDKAPGGARGHRVILTKAAAEFKASVEAGAGGEWVHEVTEDQLFDAVKESGLV